MNILKRFEINFIIVPSNNITVMDFACVIARLYVSSDNSEKINILRENYHLLPNIDSDQLCKILLLFTWKEYDSLDKYRKETVCIFQKKLTDNANISKIVRFFEDDECIKEVVEILIEQINEVNQPVAILSDISSDSIRNDVLNILIKHITYIHGYEAETLMRLYNEDSYRSKALDIIHRKII